MAKTETQLVIAYFDDVDKADEAAKALKNWDKANDEIKLGAIGVLHQTDKGKIKTKKYGQHNTGKGAKIGLLLGVLAALLGPATLVAGAAYGAVGGGIVGSFSRKGLGLSDEDLANIKTQLADGKAALAVLAEPNEVEAVTAKLSSLGGAAEAHDAPTDEIQQVAEEVNAPPPDEVEDATATAQS
jgi:uncharacterized membrane protein